MEKSDCVTLFADQLGQFGDSPALDLPKVGTVTYRKLSEDVEAYSTRFGSARRLILLEFATTYEAIVAYLAALKTRNPIILTDPGKRTANNRTAEQFGVELFISSDGSLEERSVGQRYELHPCLAVLLSTSGSTGTPRLVRLSRQNIQSPSESTAEYLEYRKNDVAALALPLHFGAGLFVLNSHLLLGAKCSATDIPINSVHYLEWLRDARITNFTGVPYAFEVFEQIQFRKFEFPDLKNMTVLGGKLPFDIMREYVNYLKERQAKFYIDYGQTEANRAAYLPPEAVLENPNCIGRAAPGVELYLADEDGSRITEVNTQGELVIVGPNVMMGYATCGADLSEGDTLQERYTGDFAERTTADLFKIVGRKARFSKIAGFRVSHENVEEHLAENGISALVTGTDKFLVVALTDGTGVDEATTVILQCTTLNSTQLKVFHLEEVPRLSNGKPDYQTIRAITETIPVKLDEEDTANPILKAFAEAFWPLAVTENDSFDSLGGDSLTYVQLTLAIEKEIGKSPPNWEDMPISKLLLERERRDRWVKMDPNTYLRAFAIILVVLDHLSDWGLRGGAPVLMILVGYNVARFQSKALFKGRVGLLSRSLAKNLFLYYLVLLCWFIYRQDFSLQHVLLLSNIFVPQIENWEIAYNSYWFVEAYVQILLFAVCVFSIPWVRKRVSARPLMFGICAFALSLGLRFAWNQILYSPWNAASHGLCYPVFETAFLAAMGWCLYFAKSNASKVLTSATAILTLLLLLIFKDFGKLEASLVISISIILISAQVRLPAPAKISLFISTVAACSYAIYLLHLWPFVLLDESGHRMTGIVPVSLGFALGFAGQWGFDRLSRLFVRNKTL
jgi:acyl carrier protein